MNQNLSKYSVAKALFVLGHKISDGLVLVGLSVWASILFRLRPASDGLISSQRLYKVKLTLGGQTIPIQIRLQDIHMVQEIFVRQDYAVIAADEGAGYIVDLGGNIGLTSLYFRTVIGMKQAIITLEPSSLNYSILAANTERDTHITIVQKAVSNTAGIQEWHENTLCYNSKLAEHGAPTRYTNLPESTNTNNTSQRLSVEVVTMPDLIQIHDLSRIALLKVDIEGAEVQLFQGDISWLTMVDYLMIEIHDEAFVSVLTTLLTSHGLMPRASHSTIHHFYRST